MNLTPLFLPIVVMVGIKAVLLLGGSDKHQIIDGNPTYRYPRGIVYFILIGYWGIVALIAFLALPQAHGLEITSTWIMLCAFASLGIVGPIYFYYFRVVLNRHAIRAGAFFFKEAPYADIVRVEYVQGQRRGLARPGLAL